MLLLSLITATEIAGKRQGFSGFDEDLIFRVGKDDMEALREIYDATVSELYGFALSITKNTHDAQDALQETYIRLRETAHMYKPHGKPMAWLCTITRNICLMKIRQNGKVVSIDAAENTDRGYGFDATESENKMILASALEVLNDEEREIVMLHAVTGLKHREIADILAIPLATVLSKYTRSLKKMKVFLEEGGHSYEQ